MTETLKVYKYGELSDDAKKKASDAYAEAHGYMGQDEALDSIKKLAEHFGGKVKDYEVSFFNESYSSMKFEMPEMEPEEIKERLEALGTYNPETLKGNGDCELTGVSYDEDAIDGFRIAFLRDGVTDLNELMQAAFRTWLESCQDECKAEYEPENFEEHADGNGYRYLKDGTPVRKAWLE